MMKSRSSKLFAPITIALLVIGAFAVYQLSQTKGIMPDSAMAAPMPGIETEQQAPKPAPDFELKDVDGNVHHLSDYKGKVVMLNFWATWCPPCRKEIPEYIELQKEYGPQGVQFLGIALDDEGLAKVKPWLTKNPVSYPILLPDQKVTAAYGDLSSIPVTFVIDKTGIIRASFVGLRQKPVVEDMIKSALAGKS